MNLKAVLPPLWPLWLGGLLVLILGMKIDVMEVDSAQYASIGREMLHNDHWLEVYEHGETYNSRGFPDKPPLIFWAGAAGMWLLGENNWGFKLLATLSSILGIFAVGRWAALLFGTAAKWPARLFYGINAGFLLMNQDLRTDAMLVNFILISCWQLESYLRNRSKSAFIWAFVALALGMLAKGPVALIAVLAAFGPDTVLKRDWKRLFRAEWFLGLALVLVLLAPMLYGLYTQWGWEKGIKYYFWTQSFGRITGENVWENNLPAIYLLENFAWAFLPWVPLFLTMLVSIVRSRFALLRGSGLSVPAFGFVLMMIAMSMSRYKLPHYVYVCWPFAAVWLAGWWAQLNNTQAWWRNHAILGSIIAFFSSFLAVWSLNWSWLLAALPLLLWVAFLALRPGKSHILGGLVPAVVSFLIFGLFANGFFYPKIMDYQSSSKAGQWAQTHEAGIPLYYLLNNDESVHALHFYSRQVARPLAANQLPGDKRFLIYTTPELADAWQKQLAITTEKTVPLPFFKITKLTPQFLSANSRSEQLEQRVLLTVNVD